MRTLVPTAVAAFLFGAAMGAGSASQAPGDDRARLEELQRLASQAPRPVADPDVRFLGDSGRVRAGVRCATREVSPLEVDLNAALVADRLAATDAAPPSRPLVIPVVFHVVRARRGQFDVPRRQITAQIEVLNEAFGQHGFEFRLMGIRRTVDGGFAHRCGTLSQEKRFKRRHAVDPTRVLNVYTCRPSGGVLGFSWFPTDWDEESPMHGVVVRYSTLPGGGAAPYDEGDTLVHEVGHWAGLYHTFQGGCRGGGDRVDDTPAQARPTFGCPGERDTCTSLPGVDPIENFMDYSDDACMDRFSRGQTRRMLEQTRAFRSTLVRTVGS